MAADSRTVATPGPWEWRGNQLWAPALQVTLLRDVTFWNHKPGDKPLIAAAPELLTALRRIALLYNDGQACSDIASEAIAKIEGRE